MLVVAPLTQERKQGEREDGEKSVCSPEQRAQEEVVWYSLQRSAECAEASAYHGPADQDPARSLAIPLFQLPGFYRLRLLSLDLRLPLRAEGCPGLVEALAVRIAGHATNFDGARKLIGFLMGAALWHRFPAG